MATNIEIQKLFIFVPEGLANFFIENQANTDIVDPKKIYFFEDGRIWTNGRTYSKSDAQFDEIFNGIDAKISAEEARAIAAEQQLQANIDTEVEARTQAIEAEAAARTQAIEAEASAREQAIQDEADARIAADKAEKARAEQAEADLKADIEQAVADAKSYSVAKVEGDELSNLGTTVKEAFKLVDEDGVKCGEYIKIYKDSAIKSVALEDVVVEGAQDTQNLVFTYILADGTESVVKVDISQFVTEAEHGDGLQVNEAGVVSVKRDETSEAFLSVSSEGIKVAGVQDAINTAVAAEKAERIAKDEDLARNIDAMGENLAKNVDKLAGIIKAEEERAIAKEEALDTDIKAEAERAKGEERQLQLNIEKEAELRVQDVTKLSGIIAATKSEFNAELVSAVDSLNKNIQTEAETRLEQDQLLSDAIAAEKTRAEKAEADLQIALDDEIARAEAKEAELEGKLGSTNEGHAQDIADVRAELAAEKSRAEGKEAELAGLIDAEQTRAESKEAELAAAIKAEEERAIAVENTKVDWTYLGGERKAITLANHDLLLGTATNGGTYNIGMISKWDVVDLGTTSLPINLNTPAGVRPTVQEAGKSGEEAEKIAFLSDVDSANANLNAAIEAEAARAKAAEEANAAAIKAEAEAARAAEDKLTQDLAKEAETRDKKDDTLATSISWLSTAVGKMNDDYKAADTQLQTNIDAAKAELQQAIQDEADARIADVDAEEARALAAEAALQAAIDAEQTRAEQAEAALQGALDQEAVNREGADIELQGAINTEKARAEKAESDLQDALDAEIERAKKAEAENNSIAGIATEMVVEETARATGEEQRIEGKLDAEITRATGEEGRIEAKFDAAVAKHTYSVVKLTDEELAGLSDSANVQEAFKLIDGDKLQAGETIKVYKDSSLKSVALEDVVVEGAQDTQNLVFTYILADGTESVVKVDISQFVTEAEFKAGLQVIGGEVSVKLAEDNESFLSVDMNGVKLAGVQAAIDSAVAAEQARAEAKEAELDEFASGVNTKLNVNVARLDKAIADETKRATDAEADLQGALDAEKARAEKAESDLQTALEAEKARAEKAEADEKTRAEGKEAELADLITAEETRAIGREGELQTAIENEATTARAAEKANADAIAALTTSTSNALADAKAELQKAIDDEVAARTADVDAEETRAKAAENVLTDNLAAEVETARAAEDKLTKDLAAEVTRATAKEGDLSDAIQNTFNQAAAGLQTLQNALDAEVERAEGEEQRIEVKFDKGLADEVARAQAQEDVIEAAIGLNADGTYATIDANYTDGAKTIVEAIRAIDDAAKVNADDIDKETIERLAADAKETSERKEADLALSATIEKHVTESNERISKGLEATLAAAKEYTSNQLNAYQLDHNVATTGKSTIESSKALAEKVRAFITVKLSESNGKVQSTSTDENSYVDVMYSAHSTSNSTVSDGIVTGEVLVSVLDDLWETFKVQA